jgi:hypothetical protein
MLYELPPGVRTAQELDFRGAAPVSCGSLGPAVKGVMIPMGRGEKLTVLGNKCYQYGGGSNNQNTARWRRRQGPDWEGRNRTKNRRRRRGDGG